MIDRNVLNSPLAQNHGPEHDYTALWIILGIVAIAAIIAVSVILYRHWRTKNCYPIYFAGKVRYGRKGVSIKDACATSPIFGDSWIIEIRRNLTNSGYRVLALYTDNSLTQPLNERQLLTAPLYIYPKLEK